jgi:antitoxin ParD1/3/4
MATIHVNLSEESRQFVEKQIAAGGYHTADAYLEQLIEEDRLRKAQDELEELLLAGMRSPRIELTPEEWESMRREADARVQARTAS